MAKSSEKSAGKREDETEGKYATVQTTPDAKAKLQAWIDASPLKPQQGQTVAALILWFCRQEPLVQTAVLSNVDIGMEMAYAQALYQLSRELEDRAKKRRLGHEDGKQ